MPPAATFVSPLEATFNSETEVSSGDDRDEFSANVVNDGLGFLRGSSQGGA